MLRGIPATLIPPFPLPFSSFLPSLPHTTLSLILFFPSVRNRHPPGQVCFMKTEKIKLTAPWEICQLRGASHTPTAVHRAPPPWDLAALSHSRARHVGSYHSSMVQVKMPKPREVRSLAKVTELASMSAGGVLLHSLCAGPQDELGGGASPWGHSTQGDFTHSVVVLFIQPPSLCLLMDLTFLKMQTVVFTPVCPSR